MAHKRVLQLIPTLGHGGAERQIGYLSRGLSSRGWQVVVASISGGPLRERLERSGARLVTIPARGSNDPMILARLIGLIREFEPAVVHTWLSMMDVFGGAAARITGIPWVISERSNRDAYRSGLKMRLRVWSARGAAAVISNSEGGDRYWADVLATACPRFVIRNGIPIEEIDAARPADPAVLGLPSDVPLLLTVGRFDDGKNESAVIDAFERVIDAEPAAGVLFGSGPRADDVKRRIAGQARIRAPGVATDVFGWMRRAQVFISMSRFEGMPNAVMEAMAAGCPLVVSDIAAHREILDARAALWVSPDDPGGAAEAIRSILGDPDSARQRAAIARERAREWSIEHLAAAHERVYDQVMAGARA